MGADKLDHMREPGRLVVERDGICELIQMGLKKQSLQARCLRAGEIRVWNFLEWINACQNEAGRS